MTPLQQHDADFYRWTQDQAAPLRAFPRGSDALDIENLAEEIEDMGRAEIQEISSRLRQTLARLVTIAFDPEAPSVAQWVNEASGFQGDAVLAVSPGLGQRLDLPKIWMLAKRNAADGLSEHGLLLPPLPDACPLTLDQLLDPGFSPRAAAAAVAASAPSSDRVQGGRDRR